jgi:hypothetical protein
MQPFLHFLSNPGPIPIYICEKILSSLSKNNGSSFNLVEPQGECVKDPDFLRVIKVSLEDIFYGRTFYEIVRREIRETGKQEPGIEEARYTIPIEPGCPDGKEFRFIEVGHRDPTNIPADLVVKIQTEQHRLYERVGADLIYKAKISLDDVCIFVIFYFSELIYL